MHDPSLHRLVYGLMSKLFKKLMAELKLLGAQVVFANFGKIIIDTKKYAVDAAEEYLEFIVTTIKANDMFQFLQIHKTKVWEQLLWLEKENWGGIQLRATVETSLTRQENTESRQHSADGVGFDCDAGHQESIADEPKEDDGDVEAVSEPYKSGANNFSEKYTQRQQRKLMRDSLAFLDDDFDEDEELNRNDRLFDDRLDEDTVAVKLDEMAGEEVLEEPPDDGLHLEWNIAAFLPDAAAQYFNFFIAEFMQQYRTKWLELTARGDEATGLTCDEYADKVVGELFEDTTVYEYKVLDFMRGLLTGKITKKTLEVCDELALVYGTGTDSGKHFPRRAGSHLQLKNPALEFAKAITHVFALDGSLEAEVQALRRNLLTKLEIREFDPISEFQDPSLSYVLRDVICSFCSKCRDIDLLRDHGVAAAEAVSDKRTWEMVCPQCFSSVDLELLEGRLIQDAYRISSAFLLQDFRCPYTNQVSIRYCADISEMSKPLRMDIPLEDLRRDLDILLKVAEFHGFELLEYVIREM